MIDLVLPTPPSTNNLFATAGNRRIKSPAYEAWLKNAEAVLWTQRVERIRGPVVIEIGCEDNPARDLDNQSKAPIDFLVRYELIAADNGRIVRRLTLYWHDEEGCRVRVLPLVEGKQP